LVEESDVGLGPSIARLAPGRQRVDLLGREDVARSTCYAPRRREETANQDLGGEQRPHGVERLGEGASVDHVEQRWRVLDCFRTDATDSMVAFEAVAIGGIECPQQEGL